MWSLSGFSVWTALFLAGFPAGEWETLSGEKITAQTRLLDAQRVKLDVAGVDREVMLADVLHFQSTDPPPVSLTSPRIGEARLIDGSVFGFEKVRHQPGGTLVEFTSVRLGTILVPSEAIVSLRLVKEDRQFVEAWSDLLSKQSQEDRLVIRKESVLDFIGGVIGEIGTDQIKFFLDNEEHEIKIDRVYGIIYSRNALVPQSGCVVGFESGDRFVAESMTLEGDQCLLKLSTGEPFRVSAALIRQLDFSLGKVQYLSQMEPRDVEYTPFFNITWPYRRDRSLDGNPLRLNHKTYARGLALHSRTILTYRLPLGYRRFQSIMGIDQEISRAGGDVLVIIEGVNDQNDVKELFRGPVRMQDLPKPLDLEITGVRDLRITVDFGAEMDTGDHLDLAEARITK